MSRKLASNRCDLTTYICVGVKDAGVKWPNDIWVNRKKLAGILTDSSIMGSSVLAMVGVGVRLSCSNFLFKCFKFFENALYSL